jgi:phosphoglycolate phosphatase-like HAD superfamily hydrolase
MQTGPSSTPPRSIPRPKLLLFDVDGTLLRSHGGSLRAMTKAARQLFGPAFSLEEIDRNGRLDPEIIGMALELNEVRATPQQLDAFRHLYVEALRTEVKSTRILPGVRELLAALRATQGLLLGCVTGNFAEAARMKLQAVGIDTDWFAANGFGDQAATRSDLVRLAIDRGGSAAGQPIPGRDVIVVGDTPRDVESAKANGCACLAVATGNYTVEALQAAGPDAVLADLTDPAPLWAMLDRRD